MIDQYLPLIPLDDYCHVDLEVIGSMSRIAYWNHIWDAEPALSFTYSNN